MSVGERKKPRAAAVASLAPIAPRPKVTRYIQPLGMRVLVRILRDDEMVHESGLYLPAGSKEKLAEAYYGEVIDVARARPEEKDAEASLGANVSGVPCGAKVLFPKDEGIKVPWDDSLRLIEVKHLLATVDEVSPDKTH